MPPPFFLEYEYINYDISKVEEDLRNTREELEKVRTFFDLEQVNPQLGWGVKTKASAMHESKRFSIIEVRPPVAPNIKRRTYE